MDDMDDRELQEVMRNSMLTYNREQQRTNGNESSSNDYSHLFDDVFSELGDEVFEQEEKRARGFQQELIDTILKDHHNYIVFAPTGCGKTFIASKVAQTYLEEKQRQGRKATVLFVVDRTPLVLQQSKAIKADIGSQWNVSQYCGDLGAIENWKLVVRTTHVIVVIAQSLLNCIVVNPGALSDVDILIFDECHHVTKEHPFHKIVKDHWKTLPVSRRPKILGLTASPGGKPDKYKTKAKIKALCENMHSKIIMVKDNIEELKGTLNPPRVELVNIILDPYLLEMISGIQKLISKIETNSKSQFKWPEKKTSFEYMRFCQQLRDKPGIPESVRTDCALNLLLANCVQLLEDVGLECVIEYLNSQLREGRWQKEITTLRNEFSKRMRPGLAHGKRDTLMRKLREIQGQPAFKRGIIFVKTRASAHALLQTIKNHLKFRPCLLVGHGAKGEGGMKAKSQQSVVKDFNNGTLNLMIATSVAEEGLDIQACNTVIRYDALDTAEALIQSRGRARFHDSTFIVMLSGGDTTKFFEALESEKNMHDVVQEVQARPGDFYDFLYREQPETTRGAQTNNNYPRISNNNSNYTNNNSNYTNNNNNNYDDDFGFELIGSSPSSALVNYKNTNNDSNTGSCTDIIQKYAAKNRTVPKFIIKPTGRGFLGEATLDLGFEQTLRTEEIYEKTETEVRLRLSEDLVKRLQEIGELDHFSPPVRSAPLSLPAPQSSSFHSPAYGNPISAPPYRPSSAIRAIMPSSPAPASSSFSSISSSPSPSHSSSSSSSSSTRVHKSPPAQLKLERVEKHLAAKGKTAVSFLNEWCQGTSKTLTKTCNSTAPFSCTIIIPGAINYVGPPCTSKKEAEHLAAKHVIAILEII